MRTQPEDLNAKKNLREGLVFSNTGKNSVR